MARGRLVVFLALFVAVSTASEDPTISLKGVEDLTPDTFDTFVNGGKHALVEFYAPWCGHCKRMTGEYKALGEMVETDPKLKGRVVIAKVNADEHRSLGERFDVKGFPTIKFFPRGKAPTKDNAVSYDQARTTDAFAQYIRDKIAADKSFGRVKALDALAASAGKAAADKLKAAAEDIAAEVAKLEGEAKSDGELYAKLAKKAAEKGVDYFKTEKARLERMISSGGVAAHKLDEMTRKSSILAAFTGTDEE